MADFELNVRRESEAGVLEVAGYINKDAGTLIADTCFELIGEGVTTLVINMQACKMVNSMGISCLIEVIEKVKELEGRFGFCNVAPTTAKTFKIMGLLQASSIFSSEADALQAV
jgi:anti-anti-sigma factor